MKAKIQVIYEDNHLIAINKWPGQLAQGDETGDDTILDSIKSYIKVRYEKPGDVYLGLVHRLDRPVGGVILCARTSKSLSRMNELFRNREIHKTYLALVDQRPEPFQGVLKDWLIKDENSNKVFITNPKKYPQAREAELHYKLIGEIKGICLLEVNPLTGRPHQIRAQLAAAGMPLLGDKKYGAQEGLKDRSIGLHALSLQFKHPVKKESVLIQALPHDSPSWHAFLPLIREQYQLD